MAERFIWTTDRIREALELPADDGPAGERDYAGISTDTRTIRPDELFVALRGDRFDGTEFVGQAVAAGAAGAVIQADPGPVPDDFDLFHVDDTLVALGRLARHRRRALDPTIVGVTGTSGKTTTREFLAALLGPEGYASPGNYNNLVGTPLSMLAAPPEARCWVLELATNRPGEIGRLSRIAEPDIGIITTVGEGHLEGLGDLEGVIEEKLDLVEGLDPGGRLIVADRPIGLARRARERFDRIVTVGLSTAADERPTRWTVDAEGTRWVWHGREFRLAGVGEHLLIDALLALTTARGLGIGPETMAERLGGASLPPMRGELRRLGDLTLLVDCYNANPSSFRAAIDALEAIAASRRRRAAVVGTMLELGERSKPLHERVAGWLAASGIEVIGATGAFVEAFEPLADELGGRLVRQDDPERAYPEVADRLRGDEVVLLKASRGVELERLIPLFERDFEGTDVSGTTTVNGSG